MSNGLINPLTVNVLSTLVETVKTVVSLMVSGEVRVVVSTVGSRTVIFEVEVGDDQVGKVLGKGARVVEALKTVIRAALSQQVGATDVVINIVKRIEGEVS